MAHEKGEGLVLRKCVSIPKGEKSFKAKVFQELP